MNKFLLSIIIIFSCVTINLSAQNSTSQTVELSGVIKDYNNTPLKGVQIFIDSINSKTKTDKKGFYKLNIKPNTKLVSAFSSKHGLIDIEYERQNKINFIFPEDSELLTKKQLKNLGYTSQNKIEEDYSSYTDIFQLLQTKFQTQVRISNGNIRIVGAGTSLAQGGTFPPIFIVNGTQVSNISSVSPADIKSISVERANTSLYGSRGAGGVIKIKLK